MEHHRGPLGRERGWIVVGVGGPYAEFSDHLEERVVHFMNAVQLGYYIESW